MNRDIVKHAEMRKIVATIAKTMAKRGTHNYTVKVDGKNCGYFFDMPLPMKKLPSVRVFVLTDTGWAAMGYPSAAGGLGGNGGIYIRFPEYSPTRGDKPPSLITRARTLFNNIDASPSLGSIVVHEIIHLIDSSEGRLVSKNHKYRIGDRVYLRSGWEQEARFHEAVFQYSNTLRISFEEMIDHLGRVSDRDDIEDYADAALASFLTVPTVNRTTATGQRYMFHKFRDFVKAHISWYLRDGRGASRHKEFARFTCRLGAVHEVMARRLMLAHSNAALALDAAKAIDDRAYVAVTGNHPCPNYGMVGYKVFLAAMMRCNVFVETIDVTD